MDASAKYSVQRELLNLDSSAFEEMVTDAAICRMADRGRAGLDIAGVASWLDLTRQAVNQRVRANDLPVLVATRFAWRWERWVRRYVGQGELAMLLGTCHAAPGIISPWGVGRLLGLVPWDDRQCAGTRSWAVIEGLACEDATIAEAIELARAAERETVVHALGVLGCGDLAHTAGVVLAALRGLRTEVATSGRISAEEVGHALLALWSHLDGAGISTENTFSAGLLS